jgi:O-antigen/teichoic acid export membrane protein
MKKAVETIGNWLASDVVRQYLKSSFWMVVARALWVVMAFTVGIVVIRRLGPHDFGVLNYVVAYVGIISVIASLGLDAIVERQLARQPENEGRILGNYFVFKLLSTAAMLAVLGASFFFIPERGLIVGCLVVALGHICHPFGVVQCFFFVTVQNRYNAWAQIGCCLVYNAIRLYAALAGKSLMIYFAAEALAIGLAYVLMFAFYWLRRGGGIRWSFRWREALALLPAALPMSITVVFSNVYSRTDMLMLEYFRGADAVGLYTIAVRFTENWTLLIQLFAQIFGAAVLSAYVISRGEYAKQLHRYYFMLFWMAWPLIFVSWLFGPPVIRFLYGEAFRSSAWLFSLYVLTLPCNGLLMAYNCHAVNDDRLKSIAAVFCSGALLNVPLNALLIHCFGTPGAAVSSAAAMPLGMVLTLMCTEAGRRDLKFMLHSLATLPSLRMGRVEETTEGTPQ